MHSKIILTQDWTNPETSTDHKAGEVLWIPSYILARDEHFGIRGKFRSPSLSEDSLAPGTIVKVDEPREAEKPQTKRAPAPSVADRTDEQDR